MSEIINCPSIEGECSCGCNCQAYLANGRHITVDSLEILADQYTFSYTITNEEPSVSFIIFCIQCATSKFMADDTNTSVEVIGNPNTTADVLTQCYTPGCESTGDNRYYVEFASEEENMCCRFQGIKINLNLADTIDEIKINISFTLPDDVVFSFQSGNLKLKSGVEIDTVNNLCVPGCLDNCEQYKTTCKMWKLESKILEDKKDVFVHFSQMLIPDDLDLSTLTIAQLESKVRSINQLEKCTAELNCDISKVLKVLNELKICD
ncbi:MAG: hypothetical protein ACERKV_12035 [Clostridiaceae bacterium]